VWSRRKNRKLVGRRAFSRQPTTYDSLSGAYADGLWWVLIALTKLCVGLFCIGALAGVGLLFYALAS